VGGDEERAVRLHNYLAALHYEVYILLGMAVPEGETAFVLYRNKTNQTMRVINPSTGITTNVTDPTCAMQQVWALFNQNDVIFKKTIEISELKKIEFFNEKIDFSFGSTLTSKCTRVNCHIK
jgi:hypothetical protein